MKMVNRVFPGSDPRFEVSKVNNMPNTCPFSERSIHELSQQDHSYQSPSPHCNSLITLEAILYEENQNLKQNWKPLKGKGKKKKRKLKRHFFADKYLNSSTYVAVNKYPHTPAPYQTSSNHQKFPFHTRSILNYPTSKTVKRAPPPVETQASLFDSSISLPEINRGREIDR